MSDRNYKIEVRSYELDTFDEAERNNPLAHAIDARHSFIVFTNDRGEEYILRGGPNRNNDDVEAVYGEYNADSVDWPVREFRDTPREIRSVVVAEGGPEIAQAFMKMVEKADAINEAQINYSAIDPRGGANCNSVVNTVLEEVGIEPKFPPGWHPGSEVNLLEERRRENSPNLFNSPASVSEAQIELPANAYDHVATYVRADLDRPDLTGVELDNRIAQALINGESEQAAARILSMGPNVQQILQEDGQGSALNYLQERLEEATQLNVYADRANSQASQHEELALG